jgi:D-inositol-3-phosphate glycosyltransferase
MSPVSEISNQRSEVSNQKPEVRDQSSVLLRQSIRVALLTGGGDKPYALGLVEALTSAGISVDFIGSDDLKVAEVVTNPRVNFLNLREDQRPEAKPVAKALRVLVYYWKLIFYAAKARPKLFHILWHNKFQLFDRTLLMLYYKLLGKCLVFTAHNVNAGVRDSNDSWLNRLTLKIQYRLSDHIFVHTDRMKSELVAAFRIPNEKVSVIPFGINNTAPNTTLSIAEAKVKLDLIPGDKTMLFFGNIAPYKGLEYLVQAFIKLLRDDRSYRLIIVGKPKGSASYWSGISQAIVDSGASDRIVTKIEYVPDEARNCISKRRMSWFCPTPMCFRVVCSSWGIASVSRRLPRTWEA